MATMTSMADAGAMTDITTGTSTTGTSTTGTSTAGTSTTGQLPPAAARSTDGARRTLRRVLGVNATTSLTTGIVGLVAAPWWADTLGVGSVGWLRLVSVGLVVFAIVVAVSVARTGADLSTAALLVSCADLAWVAATVVALATIDFLTTGVVLAVGVGVIVGSFAVVQLACRRQLG